MKKILCLILTLCLMLSFVVSVSAYSDVAADADAIKVLSGIGILDGFEDGTFRPEENVTRAQMAKIICHTLGYGDLGKITTKFSDVPENHWAAGYIDVAYNIGIIKGYGDGTFGPEDEITYEQAVKMMVCALGYEAVAIRQGGWPTGYLIQGAALNITEDMPAKKICSRADVAQLVYNSLEVDLMEKTYYTEEIVSSEVTEKTLLKDYLKVIKYYDAEITATPTQGATKTTAGAMKIAGYYDNYNIKGIATRSLKLEIGETNPDDYFGSAVIVYAKDNGSNKTQTALCILNDTAVQASTEVAVADFYGSKSVIFPGEANTEGTNNSKHVKLYYKTQEDTKAQYVSLLDSVSYGEFCQLVVNGVIYDNPVWQDLDALDNGVIKLVDAKTFDVSEGKNYVGSDGIYEKVIVDTYFDFVVAETDVEEGIIVTANGIDITLDESKTYSIEDAEGNALKIEDLQENDVLSVYCDQLAKAQVDNAEVLKIVVYNAPVEGTVTEKSTKALFIDDTKYKVAGELVSLDDFDLEDAGTFYLNAAGDIVYADTTAAAKDYAVVYDVYAEGKKVEFSVKTSANEDLVLTATGELDVINYGMSGSEYIKLGKTEYDLSVKGKAAEVEAAFDVVVDGKYAPYIITYSMKNDKLDTIYMAGDITADFDKPATRFAIWAKGVSAYYNKNENTFGSYMIDSSTIIFDIPESVASAKDADKIKVINKGNLTNNKTYKNVTVYEVDKNNVAKAVTMASTADAADIEDPIAIIQGITKAKNADGDDIYKVYMIQSGKLVAKTTEDAKVFDDFGTGTTADGYTQYSLDIAYNFYPGAVIIYNDNAAGEIDNLIKIYPTTSLVGEEDDEVPYYRSEFFTTWNNSANKGWYSEGCDCFIIYGQVADKNTSNKTITINTTHKTTESKGEAVATTYVANYGTANVTVVDFAFEEDADRVSVGTASDVKKGSYVLVRKADGATKDIVVYAANFEPDLYI